MCGSALAEHVSVPHSTKIGSTEMGGQEFHRPTSQPPNLPVSQSPNLPISPLKKGVDPLTARKDFT